MSANATKPANTERVYQVKRADLPASCPSPDMDAVWPLSEMAAI